MKNTRRICFSDHVLSRHQASRRPAIVHQYSHGFLSRPFFSSQRHLAVQTQKLTDIGEGISEVQVIQWFVSEGAHVEEWSPLLEVQSDKAADTITSRFAGVVRKLHARQDDTVKTGSALCEIDVEEEVEEPAAEVKEEAKAEESIVQEVDEEFPLPQSQLADTSLPSDAAQSEHSSESSKHATLATPAVRGLLKAHNIDIQQLHGTGKDGRVMKEDVLAFVSSQDSANPSTTSASPQQIETAQKLTPVQAAMFRTMTAALQIPHFLYSDDANITSLSKLRRTLNFDSTTTTTTTTTTTPSIPHLTYLPFIIKALSLSLHNHPLLNSRLDTSLSTTPLPRLVTRSSHNIGIALDTPSGLLVPVIKSVQTLSIPTIASEITRLTTLGRAGKLTTPDLTGGTITISNIGNLGGGTVVSPLIVDGQLAILGVGKAKTVPVFDDDDNVVKAEVMTLSWCADHRVVDGATIARAAAEVKAYLEMPARMIVGMR